MGPHGKDGQITQTVQGMVIVEWLGHRTLAMGHEWRSPQCYPVRCLRQLEGDFEVLKAEILEREHES
jgi:hypothetical protein